MSRALTRGVGAARPASPTASTSRFAKLPLFGLANTLLWFVVIRLVGVLAAVLTAPRGNDPNPIYLFADYQQYIGIAESGYENPVPNQAGLLPRSNLVFFPLMPYCIRIVSWFGIPSFAAGMICTFVASLFAAWAIYRIGERIGGPRVGFFFAVVWGTLMPASLALSIPLSEAPFVACAAWSLLFLMRREMLSAASVAILAGLARNGGVAVVAAVVWIAILNFVQHRERVRSLLALVIAPLGILVFAAFLYDRVGAVTGYFDVQKAWGSKFDFGAEWFKTVRAWFAVAPPQEPYVWVAAFTLVMVIVLTASLVWMRPPSELLVFTFVMLVLIYGVSNIEGQSQRLVIAVFTLALPVAVMLSRIRIRYAVAITASWVLVIAAYGAYLNVHGSPSPLSLTR